MSDLGWINRLAEERIAAAVARGEFENLPGLGKPLVLDDDRLVPEDLRVAYRLLKNAGYMPQALALRHDVAHVEQLIAAAHTQEERLALTRRLEYLLMRLDLTRRGRTHLRTQEAYYQKLCVKFHAGK